MYAFREEAKKKEVEIEEYEISYLSFRGSFVKGCQNLLQII